MIGGAVHEARIGWPCRLRNLGADAAGKRAYVQLMSELYHDQIGELNAIYGTQFDSFDALLAAENWRRHTDLSHGNEARDNVEFLKKAVDHYYRTDLDAIRRYDPNHLFVGDKLNANTDALDTLLPITSRYTDIVFYQMYEHSGLLDGYGEPYPELKAVLQAWTDEMYEIATAGRQNA